MRTKFCSFCGEPFQSDSDYTRLPFCSAKCRQYYYMEEEDFQNVVNQAFYEGEVGDVGEIGFSSEQRKDIIAERKQSSKEEV